MITWRQKSCFRHLRMSSCLQKEQVVPPCFYSNLVGTNQTLVLEKGFSCFCEFLGHRCFSYMLVKGGWGDGYSVGYNLRVLHTDPVWNSKVFGSWAADLLSQKPFFRRQNPEVHWCIWQVHYMVQIQRASQYILVTSLIGSPESKLPARRSV